MKQRRIIKDADLEAMITKRNQLPEDDPEREKLSREIEGSMIENNLCW